MPNTLAHFGIQTLSSKALFPKTADLRWIALGCLIPDIPWIVQRLVLPLHFFDPVDLRLYVSVQSSLMFCLLLSAAISLQAEQGRTLFLLLAWNCLFHLLLDPLEIKWGNGTLLAVPFSWEMTAFSLFWPEQAPTLLLTLLGLLYFPVAAWRDRQRPILLICSQRRKGWGLLLLLVYLVFPLGLLNASLKADNHYAATLKAPDRSGQPIALDRRPFQAEKQQLLAYTGEHLLLQGADLPKHDGLLSVQGTFVNHNTILIAEWKIHQGHRDIFSMLGIFLWISLCGLALYEKRITIRKYS
jgi:hypothetical protein